ncbi:MAG: exonuclease domain-containing protein, partial [Gemmatimonadales bacterium]
KKAWRFIFHVENLAALGQAHHSLPQLVDELLSQNVGKYRNPLEDRYDELTDPAEDPAVVELADRLRGATSDGHRIWVAPANGLQFALRRLMVGADLQCPVRYLTDDSKADADDLVIDAAQAGITLRLFKALQLVSSTQYGESYPRFVCFDLETTDKDPATCGIVEIGAVRVERGRVVDRFRALVNPGMPVAAQATEVHGYTEADLADQPSLREVWPAFREFVGSDLLIAHNAHGFDVPVLRQAAAGCPGIDDLTFYDTLPLARSLFSESAKLTDLAARFEVSLPRAHHALDDAEALAEVVGHLHRVKADRARRSALVSLLDYVALGLALEDVDHTGEAATVLDIARPAALGRFSDALESYSAERDALFKDSAPPVEEIIERLGGWQLMNRIRASRTARERYPSAMGRLLGLLESIEGDTLIEAIDRMLERVALSTSEGIEVDPNRVSLLTLHSTKGLEFSRVYIVGVEDYQIPGYYAMEEKRQDEIQESRRLLYVGMTRARDRLVLTRVEHRAGKPAGGGMFLAEMGLEAVAGGR